MTGETPGVRSDKRKPKMAAMAASICIQISKRKSMYIGSNAQNLKKWVLDMQQHTITITAPVGANNNQKKIFILPEKSKTIKKIV